MPTPFQRDARARRHRRFSAVYAAVLTMLAPTAGHALPQGAQPVFGQTQVQAQGSQMTIVQGSAHAGLDWTSFSIGAGEGLTIQQPSSRAILFNRVLGQDPSQILGSLQANGRVFLSNPRGVVFGQGSRVDAAALVGTTLSITDDAMRGGRIELQAGPGTPGRLVQHGRINASGTVALVAPDLEQHGEITAPRIGLAAAERVSVDVEGDGLIFFNVGTDNLDTRLRALGTLTADGGLTELRAQARAGFADTVLNLDGVVQARSLGLRNGRIVVDGGTAGITDVRGTLDATGPAAGSTGGAITVLGDKVGLFDQAVLDASGAAGGGTVLVGGNYRGQGPERNAAMLVVGSDASVRADATDNGPGGRIVLWSDESTRFYGSLSASGGATGGDGGFAEVSGRDHLDFFGHARVAATAGRSGTLLLDPRNLEISTDNDRAVSVPGVNDPSKLFQPDNTNPSSRLNWNTVNGALGDSTNVVITTKNSTNRLNEDGTITVTQGAILGGTGTLTIESARNIQFNEGVAVARSDQNAALVLRADGDIRILDTATVGNASGGTVLLLAEGDVTLRGAVRSNKSIGIGGASLAVGVDSDAGAIASTGDVAIAVRGNISFAAGSTLVAGSTLSDEEGAVGIRAGDLVNFRTARVARALGAVPSNDTPLVSLLLRAQRVSDGRNVKTSRLGIAGTGSDDTSLLTFVAGRPNIPVAANGINGAFNRSVDGDLLIPNIVEVKVEAGGVITTANNDASSASVGSTGPHNVTVASVSGIEAQSIRLQANTGTITQEPDARLRPGAELLLRALSIDLDQANVIRGTLAVQTTAGNARIVNADTSGFDVGTVAADGITGFSGITTAGNPAPTLTLSSAGPVTQSQKIIAPNLVLQGNGAFTLDGPANEVSNVAAAAGAGAIALKSTQALSIGVATTGITRNSDITLVSDGAINIAQAVDLSGSSNATLRLSAVDDVTQTPSGTIKADALGVRAKSVNLDQANAIQGTLAVDTTSGNARFVNAGTAGFDIGTVSAATGVAAFSGITVAGNPAPTLTLSSAGPVTQSQKIVAPNLVVQGNGAFTLNGSANEVSNVAAAAGAGAIALKSTQALTIGVATTGITRNSDITLVSDGAINVAQAVDLSGSSNATLRLSAVDDVTQTPSGTIKANALGVRAKSVNLDQDNQVARFAGRTSDGSLNLKTTVGSLAVDDVSASSDLFESTSGITAVSGVTNADSSVGLQVTNGSLNLIENVDAGLGTVYLVSGAGSIFESGGSITAANLSVAAPAGSVVLGSAGNAITGQVAGSARDDFGLKAQGPLNVGSVGSSSLAEADFQAGITSSTADIVLVAGDPNGVLTINQPLLAGGAVGLQASSIVLGADGAIAKDQDLTDGVERLLLRTPSLTPSNPTSIKAKKVGVIGAGLADAAQSVSDRVAADVGSDTEYVFQLAADVGADTDIVFQLPTGNLVVANVANVVAGPSEGLAGAPTLTVDGVAGIKAKNVKLTSDDGTVTQEAGAIIQASGSLRVSASGNVLLGDTGNSVDAAVALRSVNGSVLLGATTGYEIGTVDGLSGITANRDSGTVELNTGVGEVDTVEPVTQSADVAVSAHNLVLRGAAAYELDRASNSVINLAADSGGGEVHYVNAGTLTLAHVDNLPSGRALPEDLAIDRSGSVWIRSLAGDLSLAAGVVSNASVGLDAQGSIDQTDGAITAGSLGARAETGDVLLRSSNGVGTFSAHAAGDILFKASEDYTIASMAVTAGTVVGGGVDVDGTPVFRGTTGIAAGAGDAPAVHTIELITNGGTVTQSEALSAQNLVLRGAAAYALTRADNSVSNLAADSGGESLHYVNAGALTLAHVDNLPSGTELPVGLTIDRSGSVWIRTLAGDLNLAAGVVSNASVGLDAQGSIDQTGGAITAGSLGARAETGDVLLGSPNGVGTFSAHAAGDILFKASEDYTIASMAVTARTVVGGGADVDATPVYRGTTGIAAGAGDAPAARTIELITNSGIVTQSEALSAQNLVLRGAAAYALTRADNSVSNLAADSGGGEVHYVNASGLTLDHVENLPSGTALPEDLAIDRSDSVWIRTLAGNLNLAAGAFVVEGDGNSSLGLDAAGSVVQNGGAITADRLGARAETGDVLLGSSNGVRKFSAHAAGDVLFKEVDGYEIAVMSDSQAVVSGVANGTQVFRAPTVGVKSESESGDSQPLTASVELFTLEGEVTQKDRVEGEKLLLRGGATYKLAQVVIDDENIKIDNRIKYLAVDLPAGDPSEVRIANDVTLGRMNALSDGSTVTGVRAANGLKLTATGKVTLSGDVLFAGGSNIELVSEMTPGHDTEARSSELGAYVVGGQTTAAFDILSAGIEQDDAGVNKAKITLAGGTKLLLVTDNNASIVLDGDGNDLAGGTIAALAKRAGDPLALSPSSSNSPAQLSRIVIHGNAINIGETGEVRPVAAYNASGERSVNIGLNADLVRLKSNTVRTDGASAPYMVARWGVARFVEPDKNPQLPGMVLELPDSGPKPDLGETSNPELDRSANGDTQGLRVIVGFDPGKSNGYLLILPHPKLSGGERVKTALGRDAIVVLTGPTNRDGLYGLIVPQNESAAAQSYVPSFYNLQLPLSPAQAGAVDALVTLQERIRRDQIERSISSESVTRDLREGVIVEVGTGPSATTGSQGTKRPPVCEASAGSTTSCGAGGGQ